MEVNRARPQPADRKGTEITTPPTATKPQRLGPS